MERRERIAGRYELVERLGRGGMGEVWAGWDRDLRRDVALKLLFVDDGIDPDLPMRFDREGVAAAQVNHPNVAALYDRGVHEDLLFLVMEKVDGPPLSRVLRSPGGLTTSRALVIAEEICAALAAAHRAGVIHYDIKPHNVMLAANGTVKVVDFGIAGFVRSAFSVAPSALLTPAGTPEYAAPEQFRTERGDARSDLYALGGVLFALLTGEPPFSGHNAWAIIARKATEDAPRLDSVRPDLPPAMSVLVAELLDRDPARRPRSAQEVFERLRQLRAGSDRDPVPAAAVERPPAGTAPTGSVERAVSIACGIQPPVDRAVALAHVAAAAAGADAEAAERIVRQHVPAPWQGVALLQVAEKVTEPARVRRLVADAEPRLAQAIGHPHGPWGHPEDIALLLARLDPPRAVSRLGDIEQLVLEEADLEVWRLVTVAELAGSAKGIDSARVERIVDRLERRARTLPLRSESVHDALARIAAAVYPADRRCAERLIGLAEQSTAEFTWAGGRDRALLGIADIAVTADLRWAERIARAIADEPDRAAAWAHILDHAYVAEPGELPRLIDDVERQLARARRRRGRVFGSRPTLGPGHGRDLAQRTAPAIAVFDPPRAEALTWHLGPGDRAETLVAMAGRVSGADLEQARTWLGRAYRAALDDEGPMFAVRAARLLGKVVQAAASIDQQLARRAAERLARMADVQQLQPYTLAELAENVAEVDAALARRLVDHAARGATSVTGLGRTDRSAMGRALVRALVTVMAAVNEDVPQDTANLIGHLQKVDQWADTTLLWDDSAARLAELDPQLAERLIAEYHGRDRDGMLARFVTGFTPEHPDRALRIAESFTDDEVRNAALRQIAVGVAQQCHPRQVITDSVEDRPR
ncbi:serine/threonine-protein kinase [Streptomyces cyaneus]|uniref:serine/threonine-protein kinase n=1 Tax=Streptomyces cyaneus TaxID=1904 RepID=UPI000FF898C9|nr:serine/threonine-protein kinase [Streptomyces cyaneus]